MHKHWMFALPALLVAASCSADGHKPAAGDKLAQALAAGAPTPEQHRSYMDLTEDELKARKARLTKDQRNVTQEEGTEPPFHNAYWDNHAAGIYVDVVSGEPLFSSKDKFESGTGWPSFTRPLEGKNVVTKSDNSAFMSRTEVRSKYANSHLGHVFDDGPAPTHQRYCMNSAAMRFVPAERLAAEGYASLAKLFPEVKQIGMVAPDITQPSSPSQGQVAAADIAFPATAEKAAAMNRAGVAANLEVAVVAGGCFWGMEEMLRKLDGVVATEVGYTGGELANPSYSQVSSGETGHAESVKIVFDPKKTSYEKVIKYFFHIHDPTTPNRQENDVGSQYRSAIFAQSPEQARVATEIKGKLDASHKLEGPVVTQVVAATPFYKAEDYHQKYLVKHPGGYMCHFERKFEL